MPIREEDKKLIADLLSGKGSAATAAYNQISGWIYAYMRASPKYDPDDIVGATMIRLYAILRDGKFEGESSLKTFVFSTARFVFLNSIRSDKWRGEMPETDPIDPNVDPLKQAEKNEERDILRKTIDRLDSRCRELYQLIYIEHWTHKEAATLLEISVGASKTKLSRCVDEVMENLRGISE